MSTVFISYSRHDRHWAKTIRAWLLVQGCESVFVDTHPHHGVRAGEKWQRALENAGDEAKAVLPLVSTNWLASEACWDEFEYARDVGTPIFPVLVDKLEPSTIDRRLSGLQFCDVYSDLSEDRDYARLGFALRECGALPKNAPPKTNRARRLLPLLGLTALFSSIVVGFVLIGPQRTTLVDSRLPDKAEPLNVQRDEKLCASVAPGELKTRYEQLLAHMPVHERRELQLMCLCNYINRHPEPIEFGFARTQLFALESYSSSPAKERASAFNRGCAHD